MAFDAYNCITRMDKQSLGYAVESVYTMLCRKDQKDPVSVDELKQVHRCFGKLCAICSTCFNPGEKYLIKKKKKATSTN